jgi:hypothetical protein
MIANMASISKVLLIIETIGITLAIHGKGDIKKSPEISST